MSKANLHKIAVVGCGNITRSWMPTLTSLTGFKVVALVDLNPDTAHAVAARAQLDPGVVYPSLAQAVQATGATVVCDLTTPPAHVKVVCEAARLGCHVMGEKPLADTLAHARKMVTATTRAKRIYAVMQNRRYLPPAVGIRRAIERGVIGRVQEIHCDFFLDPHFGGFREEMDEVLLLDMAIHTFDSARHFTAADPVSVFCHSFNPVHSWYRGNASAAAIFEMTDGIVCTYRGSWCAQGLKTSWESTWRIIGEYGTICWDGGQGITCEVVPPALRNEKARRSTKHFLPPKKTVNIAPAKMKHQGHVACIRDMASHIRAGTNPQTHCEDNIRSLAMVEYAIRSAHQGRKLPIRW